MIFHSLVLKQNMCKIISKKKIHLLTNELRFIYGTYLLTSPIITAFSGGIESRADVKNVLFGFPTNSALH